MKMKKSLLTFITGIAITMAGCAPTIEKKADVTGDGIEDIRVKSHEGTFLFIGQKDGGYVRAELKESEGKIKYFLTDDKRAYFFDGKFYVEAKPEINESE